MPKVQPQPQQREKYEQPQAYGNTHSQVGPRRHSRPITDEGTARDKESEYHREEHPQHACPVRQDEGEQRNRHCDRSKIEHLGTLRG